VAVGWSQRNTDFWGRENAETVVTQPWRGMTAALVRARIPHVPLHLDHLDRDADSLSVLVLPNIGILSDTQIASIRRFVQKGGSIVATGQTGAADKWGDALPALALADMFGVTSGKPAGFTAQTQHTYLRLAPELRAQVDGPKSGDEPPVTGARHEVLAGFDETDLLPYGGTLGVLGVTEKAKVLLTFVPSFPETPPEIVWMRTPKTEIPGLILNQIGNSRIAFMPADIDRRFAIDNLPDHGDLLANVVRWAAGDSIPLAVQGAGLINCELYRQDNRLILHVVNCTSAGTWRAPVHELIPVGPLDVKIRWPMTAAPKTFATLVAGSGGGIAGDLNAGWARFQLKSVLDHEVVVIET
jgi:hypothetical protein